MSSIWIITKESTKKGSITKETDSCYYTDIPFYSRIPKRCINTICGSESITDSWTYVPCIDFEQGKEVMINHLIRKKVQLRKIADEARDRIKELVKEDR